VPVIYLQESEDLQSPSKRGEIEEYLECNYLEEDDIEDLKKDKPNFCLNLCFCVNLAIGAQVLPTLARTLFQKN
jgi:hypothetical protein